MPSRPALLALLARRQVCGDAANGGQQTRGTGEVEASKRRGRLGIALDSAMRSMVACGSGSEMRSCSTLRAGCPTKHHPCRRKLALGLKSSRRTPSDPCNPCDRRSAARPAMSCSAVAMACARAGIHISAARGSQGSSVESRCFASNPGPCIGGLGFEPQLL